MIEKMLADAAVKRFKSLIDSSNNIVLTCHVRPDGDAIGSTLGLWHLIREQFKNKVVTVVTPDQIPRSLYFLPGSKEIVPFTKYADYAKRLLSESDLIICCDFNIPSRQDDLAEYVQNSAATKVMIDHHQDPGDFADLVFSFPDMSSTCELVFRIIAAMGLYTSMSEQCAECILTGLITDTRNFTVNCSQPDIYTILSKLLEKGVDKQLIVKEALESKSLNAVKLTAYALANKMEIFPEHHASLLTLSADELDEFGYERGDTEGLVNIPLQIRGVVYSIFMREDKDCIKVSARSESKFPVSDICSDLYGGGGHLMAAGGEFHGSLEECRRLLVENMGRYDRFIPKNVEKL